jgi:hypothetical protein
MEKLVKQCKRWMAALGVVAFLMVAGWQVRSSDQIGIQEKEEIEAIANSGTPCGGPKDAHTATCLSENTINCKDLSGCQ